MTRLRAIAVLCALLALTAFAGEPAPTPAPTPGARAKKKTVHKAEQPAAKPATPGEANMIVTKDPETGELRPATAAERELLLGRHPLASREHKVVTLPDGSVMVELGETDMSYAVAARGADGTISQTCVHGAAAARKASPTPASAPTAASDR